MKTESVMFAVAGVIFGLIAGWVIGAQQATLRPAAAVPAATTAAAPAAEGGSRAAILDEAQVTALKSVAGREPTNAQPRVQLGNLYFDAERYAEAITWYEASLGLDPKQVDVSTDLGVGYYYANQADRALAQFERSLQIQPKHTKTMLNIGVVRAFGKQDLNGAAAIWQQVVDIAPESREGQAAKRMIEAVRSAHPETPSTAPGAAPGPAGAGTKPRENGAS